MPTFFLNTPFGFVCNVAGDKYLYCIDVRDAMPFASFSIADNTGRYWARSAPAGMAYYAVLSNQT